MRSILPFLLHSSPPLHLLPPLLHTLFHLFFSLFLPPLLIHYLIPSLPPPPTHSFPPSSSHSFFPSLLLPLVPSLPPLSTHSFPPFYPNLFLPFLLHPTHSPSSSHSFLPFLLPLQSFMEYFIPVADPARVNTFTVISRCMELGLESSVMQMVTSPTSSLTVVSLTFNDTITLPKWKK